MKILRTLLLLVSVSPVLYAQQTAIVTTRQPRCRPCPRRIVKSVPSTASTPQPAPDFYVGEAKVDVVKDQTVVRLAMAQHGSVLIEVPANDGPRYIIPGDPEMATVDAKALERNKRVIVVRPGAQFLPPLETNYREGQRYRRYQLIVLGCYDRWRFRQYTNPDPTRE